MIVRAVPLGLESYLVVQKGIPCRLVEVLASSTEHIQTTRLAKGEQVSKRSSDIIMGYLAVMGPKSTCRGRDMCNNVYRITRIG